MHKEYVHKDFPTATAILTNGTYFLIWDVSDLFVAVPIGEGTTEEEAWENAAYNIRTTKEQHREHMRR